MICRPASVSLRVLALALAASSTVGCANLSRIGDIGSAPGLTHIEDPTTQPGYRPVSLPQPMPQEVEAAPNALWRSGARAFFKDERAKQVGDVLTVNVNIQDQGNISDETKRSRQNSEDAATPNFLGLESWYQYFLPKTVDPKNLVHATSDSSNDGKGSVNRNEQIQIKLAAVVTQVLPNGNLVIQGRQEVRVNFEVRELLIQGVIRPEDIDSTNTIDSSKVAEARISYGGRGQITDVQQPRYGQQLYDLVFPF
ncbi:MAG TPA: flagellar basal body L-ring protein FlgH [Alphaproteobacteria bacterium]|nr:flagellar basal body L-ring protein FlgH [Alphaproteobacteria bacterium]